MQKTLLIGEDTPLLQSLSTNYKINICNFNKYKFSNNNFIYQFAKLKVVGKVNIVANLSEKIHANLWGLLTVLDLLKRENISIENLVFPYFPYSRSNHIHKHQTRPLYTLIENLNRAPINTILTFDPHFGDQNLPIHASFKIIDQVHIFEKFLEQN